MIRKGALAAGRGDGARQSLYQASEPEALSLMQQLRDLKLDGVIHKVSVYNQLNQKNHRTRCAYETIQ